MFELRLEDNNRIVYAHNQPSDDAEILVEDIPEDVLNYRYVDGAFIYDPRPEPEPGPYAPTPQEQREMDIDALTIDHEIRLSMLEIGLNGGEV